MDSHTFTKQAKKSLESWCQLFSEIGQKRSADYGIHATRDHNSVSALWSTRKLRRATQNKPHAMLISGVIILHDNARPYTSNAAGTRTMLGNFNWELFDHPPYSADLAQSDYHLYTYL
jgi:hypothetical protein